MKPLKILAVQLPVQSHDYQYNLAHVPLAAGVLAAFVKKSFPQVDVAVLDREMAFCADTAHICNEILAQEPDIVAVSCYLWNVERSFVVVKRLRESGLKALFVAGGPDVHPDNPMLTARGSGFDVFVVGEGEEALCRIVSSVLLGNIDFTAEPFLKCAPASPANIPSPYLAGYLRAPRSGSLILESSRGCPYRCAYCYYHHNVPRVATFPLDRTLRELEWARHRGIREITFVDPSFTARADLRHFLELLASLNSDGFFQFSAELNAELCDEKLASSLARAGFRHVEVGLQSTNPMALQAINRPVRMESFVRGVKALRTQQIEVMIDLIVGLPQDTEESIMSSIDFCVTEDLFNELSLYPLSLLPGTSLRKRAGELGIIYDPMPPYYVVETPWLNRDSIERIFQYAEDITGIDYFPPEPPRTEPLPGVSPPTTWSLTMHDDIEAWCRNILEQPSIGQAIILRLQRADWWRRGETISRFMKTLVEKDPFILISWIIPEMAMQEVALGARLEILKPLFLPRSHYKDREWFSTSSRLRSCQVFIELEHRDVPGSTLLWVTPELVSGERRELWFITTCPENIFPEDFIFENTCRLLGLADDTPYRITFR